MNLPQATDYAKLRRCLAECRAELNRIEQTQDADMAEEISAAIADRLIELDWTRKAARRQPAYMAPIDDARREREAEEFDTHRPRLVAARQGGGA